ncbi:hypothetical protein DL766_002967 [Monosporascus sp. MC13-8B]|uniref:C2H2-type domain-containing protein n=1 Tax=Monosporascus cannonballus TaxID=155416 RepID=A0ABY0HHQ0_9PEZI|nr:hypothetical protein DL762_000933 [Monosporascus cannonballus]RYP34446.1 hypothetical protein DL766_002967 [Monosporascus sp. MC13-8B]
MLIVATETCREKLYSNLERLRKRVDVLYEAMTAEHGPLPLAEMICTSEDVRRLTVAALADQFKRVSVRRLAPRPLSIMQQRRSQLAGPTFNGSTEKAVDDDTRTICRTTSSGKSQFQSEPPSPPPTPKMIPDDLQSTCTSSTNITSGHGPRPMASVFSTFCPEAMKYQVDLRKAMPMQRTCRCGYDWHGWLADDKINLTVKDGFRITPRFLGKSHREGGGFGCVLCTSSGKAGAYADANALGEHINIAHTKWQMLHDLDMAGRLGKAMIP